MTDRRRNGFILLLVAGLLIASLVVIATTPTRLGLDLKGGVELVYQAKPTPQQPTITQAAIDRSLEIMRERVDRLGVAEPEIQRSGRDQIAVGLPSVKNAQRAIDIVGTTAQLFFYDWEKSVVGPDGKVDPTNQNVTGGPSAGASGAPGSLSYYDAVLRASKRPAQKRSNATVGNQWYLVNPKTKQVIAGPEDSEAALTAEKPAPPGSKAVEVKQGTVIVKAEPPKNAPKGTPDRYWVLDDNPALSGIEIKNPKQNFDNGPGGSGQPIVTFEFTDKGQKAWQNVTREIAQRGQAQQVPGSSPQQAFQHFAAVLDGQVITAPFIDFTQNPDGIDGKTGASIEGGFDITSAQDLATKLEIGALPVRLELISQSQVSATLGQEALDQGLLAGLVGFLIVAIFLLIFYRVLGVIAVVALGIYGIYFFALIKLIPITLTLPGIAGLILTIGVAADANIVIFERIKEEIRAGASIQRGIAIGYKKGLSAIIDANVVTVMTAFILFILATAGVKGFAFTLGIGVFVSLFTAVLATSAILGTIGASRMLAHPSALGAGEQKHTFRFNFMGASRWFFSMSGVILLVGALSIGARGLNLGIDFESGTRITTALVKSASEDQVREVMAGQGFGDAKIQKVQDGGTTRFQISTPTLKPAQVQRVRAGLQSRFGIGEAFEVNSIGPTFGQQVADSALIAIIASLLVISIYIALRFEWKYAVPVLIALMHDLLITAGVYSLVGAEVTTATVAALLTILGYSLYDTIIVFDRIRENVPRMPRAAFSQIVNRSMSEVLARSLATSFCTLLPILALLIFGGEVLQAFALALFIGTISGTYSSIFIASPVLTLWKERETVYVRRTERIKRESGGLVPAYAVATIGAPADVAPEPKGRRRRRGSGRVAAPDQPEEISQEEFDELVADLDVEGAPEKPKPKPAKSAPRGRPAAGAEAGGDGDGDAEAADEVVPAPDATPEEVDDRSQRTSSTAGRGAKRPRNRRHGRSR
jgi:SecD/SecF fusion protein